MMGLDIVSVPCSEAISRAIEGIIEVVVAANNVLVKKESFQGLADHLNRILPLLRVLNMKTQCHSQSLLNVIEILNREVKAAKGLMEECSKRNKLYLLMKCRRVDKRLEDATREISHALSILPLSSLDLSSDIIEEIGNVCRDMQRAEFRAAVAEEEILDKIDLGIQEGKVDRPYANNLLFLIANAVGISNEKSALKKELEEFKSEIENVKLRKDQAEAIQMDQIIALLERADAASSPQEKVQRYLTKKRSLGSQRIEPLQSFYCPITLEVMVDPVETSSGQTFERSAIEKWLAEGNNLCPRTRTPLDRTFLRPNKTLRQSIEEWKDRNTMIKIASMKNELYSEDEEEVLQCLENLQDLCKQRDQYREWVVLEDYIPMLVEILRSKNRNLRKHALSVLYLLAKNSEDSKEKIAEVENVTESIVRFLGRKIEEQKLAVALLLELSKVNTARESIGKSRGCIFLLVTMSSSDDNEAARDAQVLLENLSFSDQNIIQMAKANYFKHLLQRLSSGPVDVKLMMANALAEMELTDRNKESLFGSGVFGSLLPLIESGNDDEMKIAVVKAIKNLSTVPKNGVQMIREGAVEPLLNLLVHHSSSSQRLCEELASTVMYLAKSTVSQESSQIQVSMLESDEEIFKLFSFVEITTQKVQESILQTFNDLCFSPSAGRVKSKLLKCSALQVLSKKCEPEYPALRANALKLFCCLIEDGDRAIILEHVDAEFIENLVRVIQSSDNDDEIASTMGIIANLPHEPQITHWLLDAGALPLISGFLRNDRRYISEKGHLVENAVGAICHFTDQVNQESQRRVAEAGIIPVLVQLLDFGTILTKQRAATSLARFAVSSAGLSKAIPKRKGFLCFSAQPETGCVVHGGICTIESSFCLVEADAVRPLVKLLAESDTRACEASLDALLTFLEGGTLQSGGNELASANAIPAIVKLLGSPSSTLQEKALRGLERIFQLPELKQQYGGSAQMPLVELTQQGNRQIKSQAARVLAHLEVLGKQSSFFG